MHTVARVTDIQPHVADCELVIFDLDDTLYAEKDYVKSGYQKIARAFPQIENMAGKLWEAFLAGKQAINEVLQAENLQTEQNLKKCLEIYRNQKPDICLYDGVLELLQSLKADGKKLALITDGRIEGQRAKICALGIENAFDSIIITDELGGIEYRKPCEKAFVLTVQRLGATYEKSVYIGDNVHKDFVAPSKLGMQSILVKNQDGLYYKG